MAIEITPFTLIAARASCYDDLMVRHWTKLWRVESTTAGKPSKKVGDNTGNGVRKEIAALVKASSTANLRNISLGLENNVSRIWNR